MALMLHPKTTAGVIYFYRSQRSWGKVIFSHASVILFTGGLPQCMLGYCPPPQGPGKHPPPGPGTPSQGPGRHHPPPPPPEQSILGDTVNERAVCILLECNLVSYSLYCNVFKKSNKTSSDL